MNSNPQIRVNDKGRKRVLRGHPWVFRSDLEWEKEPPAGVITLIDSKSKFLGIGLFSPHSQISIRMLSRHLEPVDELFWSKRLESALQLRDHLSIPSSARRLIHGEADGIPSFVLDQYGEALSFQSLSMGIESQRETLLKLIQEKLKPTLIVERNDVSVRNLEQLPQASQVLQGEGNVRQVIYEGDLKFEVHLLEGQKTGAFLDQRENRLQAGELARNQKKVLDACAYQGWFSCHLAKQAESVLAIDQSKSAVDQIKLNAQLNQLQNIEAIEANVFDWFKEADLKHEKFDLINLDPPAFVKSRHQLEAAMKGYKEVNLRAIKLLNPGGFLISSSCSHHLSEEEFIQVLESAARDAKRQLQILKIGSQAMDHPQLLGFPESKYLKCLFLRVV
ncbi:MAG: class I SAM-dependent rRNA methyltransferase [Deltaproteobacteria bacterium]|nr:class I SAM-dependent rRNA methyltransferase [Deltaproteobacteria bacterium]